MQNVSSDYNNCYFIDDQLKMCFCCGEYKKATVKQWWDIKYQTVLKIFLTHFRQFFAFPLKT